MDPLNLDSSSETIDLPLILNSLLDATCFRKEKRKKHNTKQKMAIDFLMVSLFPGPLRLISYHLLLLSYRGFLISAIKRCLTL